MSVTDSTNTSGQTCHTLPIHDLGSLSVLSTRPLRRALKYLPAKELVEVSRCCWALFVLANEESLWQRLCLSEPFIDPARKLSSFWFNGSWKHTVLHASRSIEDGKQNGQRDDTSPENATTGATEQHTNSTGATSNTTVVDVSWRCAACPLHHRLLRALARDATKDPLVVAEVQYWEARNEEHHGTSRLRDGTEDKCGANSSSAVLAVDYGTWWSHLQGKIHAPSLEGLYLCLAHGAINYFLPDGTFLRPPPHTLRRVQPLLGSEYQLHNLLGWCTLEVVPLPPPFTLPDFFTTWHAKSDPFEGLNGNSGDHRSPQSGFSYSSSTTAEDTSRPSPHSPQSGGIVIPPPLTTGIPDEQVGVAGCVDRRYRLSTADFHAEYESTNTPVVLTGCIDNWPARRKWRAAQFCAHYGDIPLKANGRSTDGRRFRMPARDFFAYAHSANGEKPLYVFDKKVLESVPELRQDYQTLPYFAEDFFDFMTAADRPDYRWLLIGPDGSGTPFHTDPHATSAWNAVLEGVKRVTLYPPTVTPPGVEEELIHTDYYASEPYMVSYRQTLPARATQSLPSSAASSPSPPVPPRPVEALVFPGDVIFIPSGWWHAVINIGLTVAVTQNVCSRYTFPLVAADMNAYAARSVRRDFRRALRANGREDLAAALARHSKAARHEPKESQH